MKETRCEKTPSNFTADPFPVRSSPAVRQVAAISSGKPGRSSSFCRLFNQRICQGGSSRPESTRIAYTRQFGRLERVHFPEGSRLAVEIPRRRTVKQRAASRRRHCSETSRAIGVGHPFSFSLLLPFLCFQFALGVFHSPPTTVNCSPYSVAAPRTNQQRVCLRVFTIALKLRQDCRNVMHRSVFRAERNAQDYRELARSPPRIDHRISTTFPRA